MAGPPLRRPPGWYPDPEDPARLQYWTGHVWSGRFRVRPAWSLDTVPYIPELPTPPRHRDDPVLEGPVRPAALPTSVQAHGGAARPTQTVWPPPSDRGRAAGAGDATGGGAFGPPAGSGAAASWTRSRRPVAVLASLVAIALVFLTVAVGVTSRPSSGPLLQNGTSFVDEADGTCATSMQGVRIDRLPTTAAGVATLDPASVADRATRVSQVQVALAAIQPPKAAQAAVTKWLGTWRLFAADQVHLADYLRAHPITASSPSLATHAAATEQALVDQIDFDAQQIDTFALANNLSACTVVSTTPSARPLQIP